ncbi:MAG: hypothetical protein ACYCXK_00595 [Candidatus Humimicrobiaceae bacterium]
MKLKINVRKLLLFWELPQVVLGYLLYLFTRRKITAVKKFSDFTAYFVKGLPGGISLSVFVFINDKSFGDMRIISHEYGHSLQSVYFGWFYLIIIGAPSLFRSFIWKIFKFKNIRYYAGYPEKWADHLGEKLKNEQEEHQADNKFYQRLH